MRQLFEKAIKAHESNSGRGFFDTLMEFQFEYDEEKERVTLHVPVKKIMHNPIGVLHGGIIMYIADSVMGHLCAVFGQPSVSLELNTQFLKATRSGTVKAEAYFLRRGNKIQFTECVLYNDEGQMIAKVTGSYYIIQ